MAYFEQYIVAQLTSNFLCSIIQAKMEIKIIRENGLDIECSFKLSEWYWMFLVFKSIFNVIFVYIEFKKKKYRNVENWIYSSGNEETVRSAYGYCITFCQVKT